MVSQTRISDGDIFRAAMATADFMLEGMKKRGCPGIDLRLHPIDPSHQIKGLLLFHDHDIGVYSGVCTPWGIFRFGQWKSSPRANHTSRELGKVLSAEMFIQCTLHTKWPDSDAALYYFPRVGGIELPREDPADYCKDRAGYFSSDEAQATWYALKSGRRQSVNDDI